MPDYFATRLVLVSVAAVLCGVQGVALADEGAASSRILSDDMIVRDRQGNITEAWLSGTAKDLIGAIDELATDPAARNVAAITICFAHVTPDVTLALSRLPSLKFLEFGGNGGGSAETFVYKGAYDNLGKLKGLQELYLIENVGIKSFEAERTSLAFVRSLSSLEVLGVNSDLYPTDLAHIAHLPALKELIYEGPTNAFSTAAWTRLVHLSTLRALTLSRVNKDFVPAVVFSEPNRIKLEQLSLDNHLGEGRYWTDDDIRQVGSISTLKTLRLPSIKRVENTQLALLQPLKNLEELRICTTGKLDKLRVLKHLKRLKTLSVNARSFDAFDDLVGHESIADLSILAKNNPARLPLLAQLPALKRVCIYGNDDHQTALHSALEGVVIDVRK